MPSAVASMFMAPFQGLARRGHHRWELSCLQAGASFEVVPQAALNHGQQFFGAVANDSRPFDLLQPECLQLRLVALQVRLASRL